MSLKLFSEFVSIQSVATDKKRRGEILKAVSFLKRELELIGFKVVIIKNNIGSPPLVVATYQIYDDRLIANKQKTIGVYAHYDVQPEDPVLKWETPPFNLTVKNKKIYGRGTADDKGHVIQTIIAAKKLIAGNKLKNNLVFIFEGEEEIGSPNFQELINKAKKEAGEADVFYMLDFGMESSDRPEIFFGLRGLIAFELTLFTGKKDLHSGVYGNRVYNPINLLANLLAKVKDQKTGHILIPDFYEKIRKPTKIEMENLILKMQSDEELKNEAEVFSTTALDKMHPWLSSKIYPSFDINGIYGGYAGEGVKTIISYQATAKFSFRLIENQTPDEIEKMAKKFIVNNLPKGVKFTLKILGKLEPFYNDVSNQYVKKTAEILKNYFGADPFFSRTGGSIGAAAILAKTFNKPLILTGFTLADCNIHSPNENYDEGMFYKGIKVLEKIFAQ